MEPLRYLTDEKDRWGRKVYRTDIPMHNAVVHIVAWDVHECEKTEYIVYAEAPGWVPDESVRVGVLPGEVEVWRETFDQRVDRDRSLDTERCAGHIYGDWNIWCLRECPCGCTERKRAGVKALKRAARYAAADHDHVDRPMEVVRLSPAAQALVEREALARDVSERCVVEVSLRYLVVAEVLDIHRYDLLPFSRAEEAMVQASIAISGTPTFTADGLQAIAWAERGYPKLTRADVIARAVEVFAALPQRQRDSEWRFYTEDLVDD
jgi:hypothetical protein